MLRIIQFIANSQKICTFKSTNKKKKLNPPIQIQNSNCPGGRLAKNPHSLSLLLLVPADIIIVIKESQHTNFSYLTSESVTQHKHTQKKMFSSRFLSNVNVLEALKRP